ncbi:DUF3679 domain-containing protein [Bacillus sp. HMF5848]|uniref:YqxA family protein n=1 Tax=Bacillus sp. HMF5848 TaxID=2495421 RepID=UPI000F78B1DB|nr:YqxA family protein [Bacillus sp. HMF5848]RSK27908.1 DUF3679 domain-containing protein [Bacillus sp. HMF5848]
MVKFLLKTLLVVTILFVGVILGMQQANVGLKKMKGYDDPTLQSALRVELNNNGDYEANVLGRQITSHDISEKKQQLEEMRAFNFFSMLGKKLSAIMTNAFQAVGNLLASLFEILVNKIT